MTALRAFRRPRFWLGAWVAMLGATVIVCLLPMPAIAPRIDHFDKIEHAVGYALLAAYAAMLFATCCRAISCTSTTGWRHCAR